MGLTKIYTANLSSPPRELSDGGLRIVVVLIDFLELIFSRACTWAQSICTCVYILTYLLSGIKFWNMEDYLLIICKYSEVALQGACMAAMSN